MGCHPAASTIPRGGQEISAEQARPFLLTFDVEDWFQVENFRQSIPVSSWPDFQLRVERNTHSILDLIDATAHDAPAESSESVSLRGSRNRATFFVLGWIAERLPGLVREIQKRGHEVASHGYGHKLCRQEDVRSLEQDLTHSKKLLEDLTGSPVWGYRAPSFSVDPEVLKIVEGCGYRYDSSFNSFALHGRYGDLDLGGYPRYGVALRVSREFFELPISNLETGRLVLPWGGGGYFRLLPFRLYAWGLRVILRRRGGIVFYLHPWEVDPDQPRVHDVSLMNRFRHYVNLRSNLSKLHKLLTAFSQCRFLTCEEYLRDLHDAAVHH
jgi:polysaccharide deacetylase family protein (PEP-CTERM system associated)